MKFAKPIWIAALLIVASLPAFSGETAVLRNGFSLSFDRKEQIGNVTRLYRNNSGYMDVPTEMIASFEKEEMPVQMAQPQSQASAATAQAPSVPQPDVDQLVRESSERHRLDPDFVRSVIQAESNFKPRAVSRKGARGLMQLMPETAARLGVADPFDPKANVEGGTSYLSQLLDQYHDDPIKALAAYNAGEHRVQQYHGVPPYRETRAYVSRIVRDFNAKKSAQMKSAAAAKKTAAGKKKQQRANAAPLPEPTKQLQ